VRLSTTHSYSTIIHPLRRTSSSNQLTLLSISYAVFAASALSFVTFTRYIAAGAFTIIAVPWFNALGVHYTLTILACISALMTPVPFGEWNKL